MTQDLKTRIENAFNNNARVCDLAPLIAEALDIIRSLEAKVESLEKRLEIEEGYPIDGIHCRDATIRILDEKIAQLQTKLTEQDKLLQVMGEALRFYADPEIRGLKEMGTFNGGVVWGDTLLMDCGKIAQTALAQYQSYKEGRE